MKIRACAVIAILGLTITRAGATGYYGPRIYLDEGGRNVEAAPEFYWDVELKRIARDFKAPEKLFRRERKPSTDDSDDPRPGLLEMTKTADRADFDEAIRNGEIKPPDPDQARKLHEQARQAIDSLGTEAASALPQEFQSEFSDYHRGAFAYRQGAEHFAEARDAWQALLNRPPAERHYRTVWAAFMLGKLALKADAPDAQKWFQQTRELARQGYADSLGFAADSYGWEGRAEWKQDHPTEAARLFLTQLSLGDESAVVSIKALIPDREPLGGVVNYGVEPNKDEDAPPKRKPEEQEKELPRLERAAKDPLLRRLVTAHILATGAAPSSFSEEGKNAQDRARRWLQMIQAANLPRLEESEYLGWIEYMRGDYADAAHWLKLSSATTPAALWLKAKLERRSGRLAEAAKAMAQAWKTLRDEHAYTGWTGAAWPGDYSDTFAYVNRGGEPSWNLSQEASGDFGAFHLQRADFIQALDVFFKSELWNDAAYVAERVLTTDELKHYVGQLSVPAASPTPAAKPIAWDWQNEIGPVAKLRYLLGRRLVRENRNEEAVHYLFPPFDQLLRRYVEALHTGANQALPKPERALALFRAAWIARHDGMELMGTEMAPDGFTEGGEFPVPDLAKERISGKAEVSVDGEETKVAPVVLKATRQEIQRLAKTKPSLDIRFHYRVIAGELAVKAAALLPDNSEEKADVINMAGRWTKEENEKVADKYFDLLERRAGETTIGRAAKTQRWFVGMEGPWTTKIQAEEKQIKKELGLQDPYEEEPQPEATRSPSPN